MRNVSGCERIALERRITDNGLMLTAKHIRFPTSQWEDG